MFLGRYYHSLESKGRLFIPAPFRKLLGKTPVLTRGLDGCLYLLSSKDWKKLVDDLHSSPLANQNIRTLTRLLAHDAQNLEYDAQGRALIGKYLRQFANLTKQVVIAGSLNWVEIWDKARYQKHFNNAQTQIDYLAETLNKIDKPT